MRKSKRSARPGKPVEDRPRHQCSGVRPVVIARCPAAVLRFVLAGSASVRFDEEWNQQLPPPKVAPERLAQDILAALRDGFEDLHLGALAQEWRERSRVC